MKNVVSDFCKYLSKQALLNVYGSSPSGETLRLGNSAAGEGGKVTLMDATGVGGWEIDNLVSGASSNFRIFRDKSTAVADAFIINSSGNIWMGTSTPSTSRLFTTAGVIGNSVAKILHSGTAGSPGSALQLRLQRV